MKLLYKKEVYQIISCCFEVHNELGSGFLEKVYAEALALELDNQCIEFEREKKYDVLYKGNHLNLPFYADLVVEDKIILELKSCQQLMDLHRAQCINYLKVSGNKLALLINFGRGRLEFERIIL